MHKLLSRQIRKFLPIDWSKNAALSKFLDAISKSYDDNDSKLEMVQRSTIISSQELSEANEDLRNRANSQKKIIESLERSIAVLNENTGNAFNKDGQAGKQFDPLALAKKLEEQSSEINRISTEKDILLKNLEERNEALNNYAHMVSHDLKSPMRNINFLIGCIKEEDEINFSEQSKDNCALISENLEKMDALVDGILKHATITNMKEQKMEINIENLIAEIVKTLYVPVSITIETATPLPTLFIGKYKLELLFKNLLNNAITATEHKPEGIIKIVAEEESNYWKFSISDNGKGIAKKYQDDIFKMFKKLENDFKATGIGLALVKKIVNSFGGKIWLNSKEGEGATFFFTIKNKIMETPNLNYIQELAGEDEIFKNKFISILKDEFPIEKIEYLDNIKNNATMAASLNVHKLKHKLNILGLEKSYRIAVIFEEELRLGNNRLKDDFLKIMNSIEAYLKTI